MITFLRRSKQFSASRDDSPSLPVRQRQARGILNTESVSAASSVLRKGEDLAVCRFCRSGQDGPFSVFGLRCLSSLQRAPRRFCRCPRQPGARGLHRSHRPHTAARRKKRCPQEQWTFHEVETNRQVLLRCLKETSSFILPFLGDEISAAFNQ